MRFSFANRRPELAELDRFFRDPARGSAAKLCIVSGPTGVGKSRLVDEAVAAAGLDHAFTRVRITLGEVQFGGESGFFLRATAIAVSLANKKRRRATLEDFARSRRGVLPHDRGVPITLRPVRVIASAAKLSIFLRAGRWIASLRSQ